VKCKKWEKAATCLEDVLLEERTGGVNDPRRQAELEKLVRMAGKLYRRAGRVDRAQAVLEKGGCHAEAAEIALESGQQARAAELFLEAKDPQRAAAVLRDLGDAEAAARTLAEYHRDRGNDGEAARHFEEAGDLLAAGDLYRALEQYPQAASCYEREGVHAQAAEMYNLAGDRARAAENYERAGAFKEAAECAALEGDAAREADLLARAGQHLQAARLHREAGRDDEAIAALQQVAPEHPEFAAASALLGEIFRERGMLNLAIKKLRQAVGEGELTRENAAAFYTLATVYQAADQAQDAVDLYEKILAFDYHYEDVSQRLDEARERAGAQAAERQNSQGGPGASAPSSSSVEGRYKIVGKLGRGGMGIVYKAEDTVLERVVAFKVLPESLKENPQALKNFLREARSAAQLNHPNIVTVFDAGEQDGVYYIAMEYVDGNTLKDIIKHKGAISPGGVVHVVAQICEGLAFAHEKRIVHRDIKTANVMWTRDRKTKIMDFGLAKVVEEVRNHTTVVSGTPYYMSPEQTLGKNVDHRTDIYSLGVTMFEMATATLPFREGNLPYHHVHTPPPDPREFVPGLPEAIADVIGRCLRKNPAERYGSAREIVAELKSRLKT
jgi:tetratricopeptide (TPR) repeat protein